MPKLTVDGVEVEVPNGATVLQACEEAGADIPRFCYHERLSIAGNCRMCLVDMEKAPKPVASCAMPAGDGMVISTKSERVKKAREGVMEFLLINHPLDCPICDQGGECDLQDQAMAFGRSGSRFEENKRAVKDKYMGPLINTIMTRCIHCTRCVRFVEEVAGVPEIGAINRGENTEITALEQVVDSELSGNVIDLCPVGALTSKPYTFTSRPWELRKTETIDVMDAVGANIRVDARGSEVMRIVPRLHEDVNEEWLSDKSRFAYDGLKRQRLDQPFVKVDGRLKPAGWGDAFAAIKAALDGVEGDKIGFIAGDLACAESMTAARDLAEKLGSANIDCRQDSAAVGEGANAGWRFNSTIAGIEQADAILLIGANPRKEATLLNARIRKTWVNSHGKLRVGVIGDDVDLTFPTTHLGNGTDAFGAVIDGSNDFADVLKNAERPMIIVGNGALTRADGAAVLAKARALAEAVGAVTDGWNGFNVLHTAASRVGGLMLGFLPGEGGRNTAEMLSGDMQVMFLLGADEVDMAGLANTFTVYVGSHGDHGAHAADVILPAASYTEKSGTYVNLEGRVQTGQMASFPVGEAKEDWRILRALSAELGQTLPYDNLDQVRARMVELNAELGNHDQAQPGEWGEFGADGDLASDAFEYAVSDFYLTNPVARSSQTMAKCSAMYSVGATEAGEATGTDG